MFKHVIWDFDGTLFDTYPVMAKIFKDLLKKEGIEEPLDEIMQHMQVSLSAAVTYYEKKYAVSSDFIKEFKILQKTKGIESAKPFKDIEEICKYIHSTNRKNYLYTHRGSSAITLLKKYDLDKYFSEAEFGKEVTIRDLVRNSLRMRPDRIIVGEVRGKEAFDMMQAMNTGHEGSITTLHANTPVDAMNRLETMILMNDMEIPVSAIRNYIENAIDLVVQIDRLSDGKRKITSISEVVGIKDDNIVMKEIFTFKQSGVSDDGSVQGEFGIFKKKPVTLDKIVRRGYKDIEDIFK